MYTVNNISIYTGVIVLISNDIQVYTAFNTCIMYFVSYCVSLVTALQQA